MDILIVDDSWTVRVKFKKFLSDKGFIVHEAENGLEALDTLRCYKSIKLVISDLNMPGMDGMTFIALAKKEGVAKDIPIIFYITEISKELKKETQRLGVSAWVAKPLNQDKILQVIIKLLSLDPLSVLSQDRG
tara:strand:+ start:293 stop:691 length:399 start_codon:yes stop_codon:yes gene_type:complete